MAHTPTLKLDDFWPYQVVVLADLISRHSHLLLKAKSDLNLSQWRVLAAIADKPGRSAAEVVSVTPMDKGIVSRATAWLVDEGYVRKQVVEGDRRRSELFLTQRGETTYAHINADLVREIDKVVTDPDFNAKIRGQIDKVKHKLASHIDA